MKDRGSMAIAATMLVLVIASARAGESSPEALAHVDHALQAFPGTPDGSGLVATAIAEARVALLHAGFAARDPGDLGSMKRHVGHVLHAIDPALIDGGPGLGYGGKRAAEEAARHIELAARADGASEELQTHALHIATSARTAAERMARIASLAAKVERTESAAAAALLVHEIESLATQTIEGLDADGDGRISWRSGEGGLDTALAHGELVKKAEGIE